MKLYLNALGSVTPLGVSKESVAINLFAGSRSGLIERHDIVPDRPARVDLRAHLLTAVDLAVVANLHALAEAVHRSPAPPDSSSGN